MLTSKVKRAFKLNKAGLKIKKDILTLDLSGLNYEEIKKLSNLVYHLPVFFGKKYFIRILGIPYCLMPDLQVYLDFKRSDAEKYLFSRACGSCKFKNACPGFPAKLSSSGLKARAIPDIPLDISIELNTACNLNCRFCSKDKASAMKPLPFKNIRKILAEAKQLGITYVRFTGGEPLLRKDLVKILAYARRSGFTIGLNTNGFLLNKRLLGRIEKYVDNILFSLCGWERESEAIISGKTGGFEEKLANIVRARSSKISYLRIGTVASTILIDNFRHYAALVKKLGVNNWEFYRPFVSPASLKEKDCYVLKRGDFIKLLSRIKRLRRSGVNAYLANALPFCIFKNSANGPALLGAFVDDGHSRVVVDTCGRLKPGYFMDKDLGTNIKQAWQHPFIRKINSLNYLPLRCKACPYLKWCMGGSRGAAKINSGSYFAADPLMDYHA